MDVKLASLCKDTTANNAFEWQHYIMNELIQKEIHSVTSEQATWRLKNWKMMIANYRRRGYSYPTISRIKKILIQISNEKSK